MEMNGMKSKVLKEIMNLMDQEDGKRLMNHPKLVAAKVTVDKSVEPKEDEAEMEGEAPEMESEEPEGLMDILEDIVELEQVPADVKAKLMKFIK